MNPTLEYSTKRKGRHSAGQIETVQQDLMRLAEVFSQLADLPDQALEDLDLACEFENLHHSLVHIEARCACLPVSIEEEPYPDAMVDEAPLTNLSKTNRGWGTMSRNSKRANQLANRLTQTLRLLRKQENGLPGQLPSPEDVRRMNLSVVNSVNQLLAEWNHVPE